MARRVMGTFVALVLVVSLFLPLASVGAQEEIDPGPAPVTTEETVPESAPPPAAEEPPIAEPQPEAPPVDAPPVVEELAAEQPAQETAPVAAPEAEEPAVAEPATEEPAAEAPAAEESAVPVESEMVEDSNSDAPVVVEVADEETNPSIIENLTIDCSGLVTYDVIEAHGEELGVLIRTTDPNVATGPMGEFDSSILFIDSEGHSSSTVDMSLDPGNVFVTINSSAAGGPIAESPIVTCHEFTDPEPEPDPELETPGPASVVSGVSVTCDGAVTFTILEAHGDTLWIDLSDPDAPYPHNQLASGSFDVTQTGAVTLEFQLADQRDTVQATISNDSDSWSAQIHDCLTGEWETEGTVSAMTVSCDGAVSFTVDEDVALPAGLRLYGLYSGSWQPIDSTPLGVLVSGERAHVFDLPPDTWDSLRAEVRFRNSWLPAGIAEVSGCLDDEPDPVLPVVENLTVDCTGLVAFDLETSEPVVLEVAIFIPAAAPGYRDEMQITAGSGPQHVQFDLPVHPHAWAASISLGTEWLADALVQGCPVQPLNTLPGSEVAVPVAGGTVTFENVLEPGETQVMQLDPEFAPPLPAQYAGQLVIMVDLFTTAVIDGAAEVCLPIVGEVAEDAENVRLLHFENDAWVDITTSAGNGQICGVTSSFSPYAIVKAFSADPGPEQPGSNPESPSHHEPVAEGHVGSSLSAAGGTSPLSGLPNTGSGTHVSDSGTQTIQLLLSMLALLVALGLRHSSYRARGARSR